MSEKKCEYCSAVPDFAIEDVDPKTLLEENKVVYRRTEVCAQHFSKGIENFITADIQGKVIVDYSLGDSSRKEEKGLVDTLNS